MIQAILKATKNLLGSLSIVLIISVCLFFANESMGDPVYALLPLDASEEERKILREHLGLNQPFWSRLLMYIVLTVKGNFGNSYKLEIPVMEVVPQYAFATMKLLGAALPLGLVGGVCIGLLSLLLPKNMDTFMSKVLYILHSIPGFVPAIISIELFAVKWKLVPPSGTEGFRSLLLPVGLLAGAEAMKVGILLRSKLLEVQKEHFVTVAKAKGISLARLYIHYLLRPSVTLIFSFLSIQIGVLLSSVIVIEAVFSYPGIGSLALQALANQDLPLFQACIVFTTLLFLCSRFILEILHYILDPRIQQNESWEKSLW